MVSIFFLLNIIQAVAEFLPISSSGHLLLLGELYGISEQGLEAFLHLPTAISIGVLFFWEFLAILKDRKLWTPLAIAIIPAGAIGFLLGDYIDAIFYSTIVIGINQLVWGSVLFITAKNHTEKQVTTTDWKAISITQSLKIGALQILALIPGTSRSGITTLGGIWSGINPQSSAKFSFIIGFPLIAAASGVGLLKLLKSGELFASVSAPVVITGMLLSFVIGIFCMKLFTSQHTLKVMKYSGVYRIILGFIILTCL
jgi:undecaprenyl-diphosphatase